MPSNPLDQDWLWIKNFQEQGDRSAFENIFNKYKGLVINLSFRFVKDRDTAEEIAQEVFIKIYEKKVKWDPKSKFFTWLYRVTVNASLDFLRHKKKISYSLDQAFNQEGMDKTTFLETLADPKSFDFTEALGWDEIRKIVQTKIDGLPEKLRAAILLFQMEELSYREIAQILKITEKAAERRIFHAKELLRERLSKYRNVGA